MGARLGPAGSLLLAALVGCAPPPPEPPARANGFATASIVDLTHAYDADTVYWPTDTDGFQLEELARGNTEGGWFYSAYRF